MELWKGTAVVPIKKRKRKMKTNDLTSVQKNRLFNLPECAGFWDDTKGFQYKKTIYTVDEAGWLWVTTNRNNGVRLATYADIVKIFKGA